jgi:hypothetical protein
MVWVMIWLVVAGFTAAIANAKGRSGFGWFCLGFLFSVLALIAVAAMPRLDATPVVADASAPGGAAEPVKRCPRCAETVKAAAQLCRFCQHEFASEAEQAVIRAESAEPMTVGQRVFHAQLGTGEIDEVGRNGAVVARFKGGVYETKASELTPIGA